MPGEVSGLQGLKRLIYQRIDGVFRDDGRQRLWMAGLLSGLPLLALWGSFSGNAIIALVLNALFLSLLTALSWKSPHPWPVVASGCQWVSVMLPVLALSDGRIRPITLAMALTLSTAGVLGAMAWGALVRLRKK